jgi:hypothetical protein
MQAELNKNITLSLVGDFTQFYGSMELAEIPSWRMIVDPEIVLFEVFLTEPPGSFWCVIHQKGDVSTKHYCFTCTDVLTIQEKDFQVGCVTVSIPHAMVNLMLILQRFVMHC